MTRHSIVTLGATDVTALSTLANHSLGDDQWSETQLAAQLTKQRSINLGIYTQDELIGFVLVSYLFEEAELLLVAVRQQWQGQGVGRRLLTALLSRLMSQGIERLMLEVRASNQPALALYKHTGFMLDGHRKNYYLNTDGTREDALLMSCALV